MTDEVHDQRFRLWGREYRFDLPEDEFRDLIADALVRGTSSSDEFETFLASQIHSDRYEVFEVVQ